MAYVVYDKDALYLAHHGIIGQKWGVRRYQNEDGTWTNVGKERRREEDGTDYDYQKNNPAQLRKPKGKQYSDYNKKHVDMVVRKGTSLQTLARNPKRTTDTDMFYASFDKHDNDRYNALFNHRTPQTVYDKDGNPIGTGKAFKWNITNKAKTDIKVASRDSGAEAIKRMCAKDEDFKDFVTNPDRLKANFKKMYVPGKEDYNGIINKVTNNEKLSNKDYAELYDVVNCTLPSSNNDVVVQRAKLFKDLKDNGYGAVLDINDALRNESKSNAPVIVFDPSSIVLDSVKKTKVTDVLKSKAYTYGRYALGKY